MEAMKIKLISKRLTLTSARFELLAREEAHLHAQYLELIDLREQLREAQLSADLQDVMRPRTPAPEVIAAVA